jgi:hypothetical protein
MTHKYPTALVRDPPEKQATDIQSINIIKKPCV